MQTPHPKLGKLSNISNKDRNQRNIKVFVTNQTFLIRKFNGSFIYVWEIYPIVSQTLNPKKSMVVYKENF